MQPKCYSVIIAGGKGTRFWPLSRSQRPKQLLKILSPKTLIRETADRIMPLSGRNQTLVVTVAEQLSALRKELRGMARKNFLKARIRPPASGWPHWKLSDGIPNP